MRLELLKWHGRFLVDRSEGIMVSVHESASLFENPAEKSDIFSYHKV